jgi:CrcB protein
MGRFLFICLGGALGTGARYLVATGVARAFGPDFPRGTILINAVGSFLIALVVQISTSTGIISPSARLFLVTGVLGGFTTYSSFNYETLAFFDQGAWALGLINLGVTVVGCLVAGLLGFWVARWMGA